MISVVHLKCFTFWWQIAFISHSFAFCLLFPCITRPPPLHSYLFFLLLHFSNTFAPYLTNNMPLDDAPAPDTHSLASMNRLQLQAACVKLGLDSTFEVHMATTIATSNSPTSFFPDIKLTRSPTL